MKPLLFGPLASPRVSVGLLVVRFTFGLGLAMHGWPKIQNAFGWIGPNAPVPGFLQALAALAEFGGGLAWMVGFLTPLASLGVLITMAAALAMVHVRMGHPFVSATGGPSMELALLYLAASVLLLLAGAGRFSIDSPLARRTERAAS